MGAENKDRKERSGTLTNEEVEQDLKARGLGGDDAHTYRGSQDTGEQTVRSYGTSVQKGDGFPPDEGPEKIEGDAGPGPAHR
ncbi:hypothetical protein V9K67_21045 [Paraflavisolibacter sp. H34]|uniref:hypothetical protein n=1 Tax=Huijunlia imazamoxiresistens TaxID=3127457 RepID=UPI00301839C4